MNFFKKKFGKKTPKKTVTNALGLLLSPKSKKISLEKTPQSSKNSQLKPPQEENPTNLKTPKRRKSFLFSTMKNETNESPNKAMQLFANLPKRNKRGRRRGAFVSIMATNKEKPKNIKQNTEGGALTGIFNNLPFEEKNKIQDTVCMISKTLSLYFSSVVLGVDFIQKNPDKFEDMEEFDDDEFHSKIRKSCISFHNQIKTSLEWFGDEFAKCVKQEENIETQDENFSEKIQKIFQGNFEEKSRVTNIEQIVSSKYIMRELIPLVGDGTNGDNGIVVPISNIPFRVNKSND